MSNRCLAIPIVLLTALSAAAQQQDAQQQGAQAPSLTETVTVLGEAVPTTLGESARPVAVLPLSGQTLALPQLTDALRADPSVDLQQRGGGGVQADVSIRGASFEQTMVLLNGLRLDDAQTAHFNLDVPVPLEALDGLDVLHGAGSTLYGSDAIGGVVNIRTAVPDRDALRLRAGVGSYGINTQAVLATLARARVSEALAAARDFSTGFIADRDYRSEQASSETRLGSRLGVTDLLLAGSDRGYGAANFYGDYPSFERTKGWYAMAQQELGAHGSAAVGYRRHTDEFVLFRSDPALYENNHTSQSWQGVARGTAPLGHKLFLDGGLEEDTDQIDSTNLGRHGRNRGAGYLELAVRGSQRGGFTLGGREEVFSGGQAVFSPSASGTLRLPHQLKLRGTVGYGFRLPTYTDLYYSDPTTVGNAGLKPESAWSDEGGLDWFARPSLELSVTGFTSPQHDAIDYVRASAADKWQATNLGQFRYSGFEFSALWRPTTSQSLRGGWTSIAGGGGALNGLQSEYVFSYPIHNASLEWLSPFAHGQLLSRARLQVTDRLSSGTYPVLDWSLLRARGRILPYLQMTNLTNTGYQEIVGVRMQGRAFIGGVEWRLERQRN